MSIRVGSAVLREIILGMRGRGIVLRGAKRVYGEIRYSWIELGRLVTLQIWCDEAEGAETGVYYGAEAEYM
jgi:hypothetical protein